MVCAGEGSGAFWWFGAGLSIVLQKKKTRLNCCDCPERPLGCKQLVSPRPNWSSFLAQKATASQ